MATDDNLLDSIAAALRDPDFPIAELVRAIERDPRLAGYIVRHANSAFFAGRARVRTVREAIVRLGTANLADAVFDAAA